jgi:hypothetical protein
MLLASLKFINLLLMYYKFIPFFIHYKIKKMQGISFFYNKVHLDIYVTCMSALIPRYINILTVNGWRWNERNKKHEDI